MTDNGCEYVDFESESPERCGDDAQQYNVRNVSVHLCEPHLEAVLRDEGLAETADTQQGQPAR